MGANVRTFQNEADWLEARKSFIGGSDAACILALNPWKSNVDLWREKTGRKAPEDLSENAAVCFGKNAEEELRRLFELDYAPRGYLLLYVPFNMWTNDRYPWAHASLDGWITEAATGRRGILEIKTATINSASQSRKWANGIPANYLCQLLHYMAIADADFAILSAYLRYEIEGQEIDAKINRYRIERDDGVQKQIDYLMEHERKFAEYVKNDEEPPLVLNL